MLDCGSVCSIVTPRLSNPAGLAGANEGTVESFALLARALRIEPVRYDPCVLASEGDGGGGSTDALSSP